MVGVAVRPHPSTSLFLIFEKTNSLPSLSNKENIYTAHTSTISTLPTNQKQNATYDSPPRSNPTRFFPPFPHPGNHARPIYLNPHLHSQLPTLADTPIAMRANIPICHDCVATSSPKAQEVEMGLGLLVDINIRADSPSQNLDPIQDEVSRGVNCGRSVLRAELGACG